MADCGSFESKYKDLTPNSKPEEAQPLMEALKEINQIRLLNSEIQRQGEEMAPGLQKSHTVVGHWGVKDGTAMVVQNGGSARAIEVKNANGNIETLRYDVGDDPKPVMDIVTISCSDKQIQSSFTIDQSGKAIHNTVYLPNHVQIEADMDGKPTSIQRW
jgi:hypothetical protein